MIMSLSKDDVTASTNGTFLMRIHGWLLSKMVTTIRERKSRTTVTAMA